MKEGIVFIGIYIVVTITMIFYMRGSNALYAFEQRVTLGEPLVTVEPLVTETGKLMVHLYVFNDKTQTWDRAREDTLKNITCDKLRGFGLPSGDEYNMEVEK